MNEAYEGAIRLLMRREHGAHELALKLATKGHAKETIEAALLLCQQRGWQSDARFAEQLCRLRVRQGYGPIRIQKELQALQVARPLIDLALQKEADHWISHALLVWQKKVKTLGPLSYVALQKQKQFLLYRGFTHETIEAVVDSLPTEVDDLC